MLRLLRLSFFVTAFIRSGFYNVAADDEHWPPVYAALDVLREKSVAAHARDIAVPALDDAALLRQGAGNYAAMCAGCHLAPGVPASELSRGLYPRPPRLDEPARKAVAAQDFWVIKHGIKASGMPAWGRSMEDSYIWGLTAFLRKLPTMSAAQYQAMVAASAGHAHGGGEDPDGGAHEDMQEAPQPGHHAHGEAGHRH